MGKPKWVTEGGQTDISVVSPDKIRADKFSFNIIVLKHLDRMGSLIISNIEKDNKQALLAIHASVDWLDFMIRTKASEKYIEFSDKMQKELEENFSQLDMDRESRWEYYKILKRYVLGMSKEFYRMGIMNAESTFYDMELPESVDEVEIVGE